MLLLLMTILAAVLTFSGVAAYVSSVSSQVGPMVEVLRLTTDIEAMHHIEASDVETVEVPERWAPANAVSTFGQIEGLVSSGAYPSGSVLQTGMLTEAPGLQPGYREVAIMVDAETGVAGRIRAGDHVDILATITNDETGEQRSEVVVQNVLIINVGVVTTVEEEDASGAFSESDQIPVTFALSSEDSLRLAYAESYSVKLRLALRGAGDDTPLTDDQTVYHGAAQEAGQ
ncbi:MULTISPECIES: Flp pilus assembly protein CpaB [unclassified Actinomyces]|uniref:Flp pilus assembly protein CpaB n=1 Tax=unclassified Actinomyces TaxID=2609248 RepID=UPI002017318A|nr:MULTISPECIES: Flp pilus assembly protein CpaB [unclassified Actinomyces]